MLYLEAEMYEESLKHLEDNEKFILDKLKFEEMKGLYMKIFFIRKSQK